MQHEAHGSEAEKSSSRGPEDKQFWKERNLLPLGDDNITRLTEHRSLKHYEDFIVP